MRGIATARPDEHAELGNSLHLVEQRRRQGHRAQGLDIESIPRLAP
jgi:hypothetical protein